MGKITKDDRHHQAAGSHAFHVVLAMEATSESLALCFWEPDKNNSGLTVKNDDEW